MWEISYITVYNNYSLTNGLIFLNVIATSSKVDDEAIYFSSNNSDIELQSNIVHLSLEYFVTISC